MSTRFGVLSKENQSSNNKGEAKQVENDFFHGEDILSQKFKANFMVCQSNPLKFARSYDLLRQEQRQLYTNNFCCFSCKALQNSRIQIIF